MFLVKLTTLNYIPTSQILESIYTNIMGINFARIFIKLPIVRSIKLLPIMKLICVLYVKMIFTLAPLSSPILYSTSRLVIPECQV